MIIDPVDAVTAELWTAESQWWRRYYVPGRHAVVVACWPHILAFDAPDTYRRLSWERRERVEALVAEEIGWALPRLCAAEQRARYARFIRQWERSTGERELARLRTDEWFRWTWEQAANWSGDRGRPLADSVPLPLCDAWRAWSRAETRPEASAFVRTSGMGAPGLRRLSIGSF